MSTLARSTNRATRPPAVKPAGDKVRVKPGYRLFWEPDPKGGGHWYEYQVGKTTLDLLLELRLIEEKEFQAGLRFERSFERAGLVSKPALCKWDAIRVDGGAPWREPVGGSREAQSEISDALDAVDLYGALCLNWIIGHGETIENFVWRCRSFGWLTRGENTTNILVDALEDLQRFYQRRYRKRKWAT